MSSFNNEDKKQIIDKNEQPKSSILSWKSSKNSSFSSEAES
ncbi:hypothetical protein LEP1GSC137_2017 [Leptospira borgpetersenii str. Noumea 25]|uniref:Uncharacterized protein n=4 Tax=Leptospira borgpetersenii TaxID=174 RepID=M3H2M3_LEPBO|nr:hypothetical protein LBBP_00646 [Leptospira borgpetersenii serovar Ballum]EKP15428.1 hypothetical protein LEP1GSC128_2145 [Leptospira borgpetersenii str. 200801926]EKR02278.1 hypothetical protein LEP1GSC121_0931 [Leptospira borgpetersenii serovar Castellonis str. 200801910]EMG01349.1 hypothetical protein LEP1GSC123_3817 [Leptospira borgpetersenii str. 200701203]EMK11476.1 hypothetical protein LEP1GSC066_1757 [Leptospira sp. serovar Kenya str. Sh9]EMO09383.1 hypothetical protein LEP1GSC137_2